MRDRSPVTVLRPQWTHVQLLVPATERLFGDAGAELPIEVLDADSERQVHPFNQTLPAADIVSHLLSEDHIEA